MQLLDYTAATIAADLALEEALFEAANTAGHIAHAREVLRLWEPREHAVVLGRSSQMERETVAAACREHAVPILRRISGGLSIMTGPGCLMYSVLLDLDVRPQLRNLDQAHRFVLGRLLAGLSPLVPGLAHSGTSDLTHNGRKFSGNSLRVGRSHLLYHGTLLYDYPLELLRACLKHPPRAPDYRQGRTHEEFVMNLPLDRATLHRAVIESWAPTSLYPDHHEEAVARLIREKYGQDEWNLSR